MSRLNKILQISAFTILIGVIIYCGKSSVLLADDTAPGHFGRAVEMVAAIRQGKTTSVDLLNFHLDRIQRYNNDIKAVVTLDVDAARSRAAEADRALSRGENWGPLHGLPMTVKDVFEVDGMPTTSGDPKLKDYIPQRHAAAVQRLIDAGAIIFGKTNVPYHAMDIQCYNELHGTTCNPWNLSKTCGGSSGGSAAALAAGFTPLELGSDLGGSVRFPAHYTGVFGQKTTFGIIPRFGHIPPMPGAITPELMRNVPLFVIGPFARSADDLEIALEVLTTPSGKDERDIRTDLLPPRRKQFNNYRVAVWFADSYPPAEIDTEVYTRLQKTVERLRSAGIDLDEKARPDIGLSHMNFIYGQIFQHLIMRTLPLPDWLIAEQKKFLKIVESGINNPAIRRPEYRRGL